MIGGFADIKTAIQLRDGYYGFFSGDGIAEDIQVIDGYFCKAMTGHELIDIV